MVKKILSFFIILNFFTAHAQINTDKVMLIGRNALYYEDYVLAIQYFNQIIKAKPYLAEPYFYRAVAKYYLDDLQGAEEDCTKCIERNPFMLSAYQLRGDARQNLSRYDEAIQDYNKSLTFSPDNKFILINLGIVNIQKKDYDEAQKELDNLLQRYPNYTQGYLTRGAMYVERGDTIKGIQDYNKAIEIDKYYAQAYSMRGLTLYQQKKYEEALSDFDEAIKLDPAITGNYINRGLVRYSKNDLRGAMADYDQVIAKEPNNIIARFNRGLLRAQVGDDNRAIGDFDVVLKQEPENYIAYLNRALVKEGIGDYKGAISDLDKVLSQYTTFYQGFYSRSQIKRKLHDLKGAESDYLYARKEEDRIKKLALRGEQIEEDSKTREKSDNTIDKFNLLVVADKEEEQKNKYNNTERGRIQNRQVKIELEPRFVATYYEKVDNLKNSVHYTKSLDALNKGNSLRQKLRLTNNESPLNEDQIKEHFASIEDYSKKLVENGHNANLYFGRGIDYMLVQDFSNAIDDLNKATTINPKFALAFFNLAVVYTKQLELKENSLSYENQENRKKELTINMSIGTNKVISTTPSTSSVGDLKGDKIVEYELITKNYNKVIELDPNFAYAYYNRAEIRSMQLDHRAAILDYNEAINIDSDFAEAYYNRGLSRLSIGDKDRGLNDLRKAGELGIMNSYNIIKRMME